MTALCLLLETLHAHQQEYQSMRCQICAVSLYVTRTRLIDDPVPYDPDGWQFVRDEKARSRSLTSCSVLKDQSGCKERDLMHPNGHTVSSEHVPGPGCNSDRAYNGSRLSHLEMQGSDNVTFIVEKPRLDNSRPSYEQKSNFCIPPTPCCITDEFNVWAFEKLEEPEEPEEVDEGHFFFPCNSFSGHESLFLGPPQFVGFPVHTWCWKMFESVSVARFSKIDLQGLASLFFREGCYNCGFSNIVHHPAIAQNQAQDPLYSDRWAHAAGTEFLAANPQEIPGFLFSLQQNFSIAFEDHINPSGARVLPNGSDWGESLPYEIRTQIAKQLCIADILSLRSVSRAFSGPNPDLYLQLIRRDFPWFHEFDELEALDALYHSKLEDVRQAKLVSLESFIQGLKIIDARARFQLQLDEGLNIKPPLRQPDWERLYKNLYSAKRKFKGVNNRERIWGLVEEIVNRIEALRERMEEEWDEKLGMMLLPGRPKKPVIDWETWKKTRGGCIRCRKLD